jgi:hypothetical protein
MPTRRRSLRQTATELRKQIAKIDAEKQAKRSEGLSFSLDEIKSQTP